MSTPLTDRAAVRRMLGDNDAANPLYDTETLDELVEQASAWVYTYTAAGEDALCETIEVPATPPETGTVEVTRPKPDVKRAVTTLAVFWLRQENQPASSSFQGEQQRVGSGYAMPSSTLQLLHPYRVIGFGA